MSVRPRVERLLPLAILAGLGGIVSAAYALTKAPLYNPMRTIDPWLYTALWTNFDQIYHAFSSTYYISRVPWIVPGLALNSVFDAETSFLVLHATLFFAGGALLFFAVLRRSGLAAAASAYVALIGCQTYYDAHRWDYEEGGVIFLILATAACAVWTPRSQRLRLVAAFLAGFSAAALAATRIVDIIYVVGMAALYWAAKGPLRRDEWRRRITADAAAFVGGAAALVVVCGIFAKSNGAEFLFFMPQVRVILRGSGEGNQIPIQDWLPNMPSFFVPFAVLAIGVIGAVGRRTLPEAARRMQLGATAWLGVSLLIVCGWEFLGHGFVFELVYYFSSLLPPMALCLGTSVPSLMGMPRGWRVVGIIGASVIAVLGPLLWVYAREGPAAPANHYTDASYLLAVVGLGSAVVLAVAAVRRRTLLLGGVAVAAALFAASYGLDIGSGTYTDGTSDARTGQLYLLGQDMISFLSRHGFATASTLPRFWYDSSAASGPGGVSPALYFGSLQSLYYFSYTYVGINMPTIDGEFRRRMEIYKPDRLVLLCATRVCRGGPGALRRAGYEPKLEARRRLARPPLSVWVEIYGLGAPPS